MTRMDLGDGMGVGLFNVGALCDAVCDDRLLGIEKDDTVVLHTVLYDGRWFVFDVLGLNHRGLACNRETFECVFRVRNDVLRRELEDILDGIS